MTLSFSWQFKQHLTIMFTIMFIFSPHLTCHLLVQLEALCTAHCAVNKSRAPGPESSFCWSLSSPHSSTWGAQWHPWIHPRYSAQGMMWAIRDLGLGSATPELPICSAPSASTPRGWQMDKSSQGWSLCQQGPVGCCLCWSSPTGCSTWALCLFAANTANVNKMILAGL